MCNDMSKLRLLPDREDYKGPPRTPGKDPRPGLDGKYGRTIRQCIKIIKWCLKHHPHCKFFMENVDFEDMPEDWAEVCEALGQPLIVDHENYSTTKRRRAYWFNWSLPEDWAQGVDPIDPDTCMDAGRKCTRYFAEGHYSVRPLGASWKGHDDAPKAASNRKISVVDEQHDAPQEIRPEEAEALHGFDRGTTAASNVTAKERLQCLGGGYDINVVRLLLRPLASQQPDLAYLTECETRRLRENISEQHIWRWAST